MDPYTVQSFTKSTAFTAKDEVAMRVSLYRVKKGPRASVSTDRIVELHYIAVQSEQDVQREEEVKKISPGSLK